MVDELYVESAAYHEAAHVVLAVALQMPLRDRGIHIDPFGCGIAYYWYRNPDGGRNVGREVEREKSIISGYAGFIAQRKFYPECRPAGSWCDSNQAIKLLDEMYPNRDDWFAARDRLCEESRRLVEQHWGATVALAQALWSSPWTPQPPSAKEKRWSECEEEKRMEANEIESILHTFGLRPVICDSEDQQPRGQGTTA